MSTELYKKSDKEMILSALSIAFNIANDIEESNNLNIKEEIKLLENSNIERCKKRLLAVNKMLDKESIRKVLLSNDELYKIAIDTNNKLNKLIKLHK